MQDPGHVSWPRSAGWHSITPALPSFVAHPTGTWAQLATAASVTKFNAPAKLKYSEISSDTYLRPTSLIQTNAETVNGHLQAY